MRTNCYRATAEADDYQSFIDFTEFLKKDDDGEVICSEWISNDNRL